MLNTEFSTEVTLETLEALYEATGITVELNDGQITGVSFVC